MSKTVFIIATILISVALLTQAAEDSHRPHKHHKRQHSQTVGQHNSHLPEHAKQHLHDLVKEKSNHGPVPVPMAPHHSKANRHGRHHKDGQRKSQKGSRSTKGHQQHVKDAVHKVHQAHGTHTRKHGHGRSHH
ncbi:histidine-rich glycoprotein-like [Drosophila nasuta]|uniref:histidine-rich glycoprotein-like n=1 Tax=Drosophila nasuta TaxID=42062 RepID=UPI00295E59FC|nr:histidine-rich glycoprotein-like [Drosophila nasuta]XP_060659158.1 histidine-rich glycoprotein-like [Drosophila nasuta]